MTLGALSLACLDGIEPFFQKGENRRIAGLFILGVKHGQSTL